MTNSVKTVLNKKEFKEFSEWAVQHGFVKPDGSANIYLAAKSAVLQVTNGKTPNFAEPPSIVGAMEARKEQVQAMAPEQARSELAKWYDSNKDRKNIVKSTLFGPDRWYALLSDLYAKQEDPTAAMFFIGEFWNEELLARRAQGHDVSGITAEFIRAHFLAGNEGNARQFYRDQASLKRTQLKENRARHAYDLKPKKDNLGVYH